MPHPKYLGAVLATLLFVFSSLLMAHPLHGARDFMADNFWQGLLHPLLGLDHLLAALAVGFLAARQIGRVRWLAPLIFVIVMALGMRLATAGWTLWAVEAWIAVSLLGFGFAIARDVRGPALIGVAMMGMFALAHGYAHGLDMPSSGAASVMGILLATSVLHLLGYAFSAWTRRQLYSRGIAFALLGTGAWHLVF